MRVAAQLGIVPVLVLLRRASSFTRQALIVLGILQVESTHWRAHSPEMRHALLTLSFIVCPPAQAVDAQAANVQTSVPAPKSPSLAVLPEGTPIRMRINRTISPADAQQGDSMDFETLDDVKVGETLVIPKGSTAMATVTEALPKRRMGRGGKLNVNIDYVPCVGR